MFSSYSSCSVFFFISDGHGSTNIYFLYTQLKTESKQSKQCHLLNILNFQNFKNKLTAKNFIPDKDNLLTFSHTINLDGKMY